jgi:GT2 family glycosyltransferase
MATMTRTADTRLDALRSNTGPSEAGLPTILAVVVTHNGRAWVRDCLVGLANQTYRQLDILLVDDASPRSMDEGAPLKRVAKRHLRRRRWGYLRTPRPLGFGGAINWALGRVRTDADLLLFLHDDAALDPTSVENMVRGLLVNDRVAIVGPKVVAWDDPTRLEEIGMAADRFGYPYKGLEEGEIDLGQHDRPSDVFYVTSTCMLVRHSVFRELRGWDSHMRAFVEDLDLCWRARVAGHIVRVEPRARARHAIALATGQRRSPFTPSRYYIRRNRLRAISKNASAVRLLWLIPQFVLLAFLEMLVFILLRQPGEIINLGRALAWNLVRLPQTVSERARVQRRRTVPDRKIMGLTVRETTRIRAYTGYQAQRLEQAWGRRAELLAVRTAQARALTERLVGAQGAILLVVALAFIVGFRHVLWGPTVAAGEILPFPESPTALLRSFLSPWQPGGLGSGGAGAPSHALLGSLPMITFGATGLAQKVVMLGLGGLAFVGAYKLVSELVDRTARLSAGLAYAFGAVGYAGIREGGLGALVLGAMAPFVLHAMLRLIGWMRPPGFVRSRGVAQIALGGAVSAAFVPGSLFLFVVAAVILAATRTILDRGEKAMRGAIACAIGLVLAWALLLPWSLTWFSAGGIFERLGSDATYREFAHEFSGHGIASVLLGQTPRGMPLFGLALPLFGLIAVVVGEGARRRLALALWVVIAAAGWITSTIAAGVLRPVVTSPAEAGVLSAVAFAGLTGLAVGAFRLDLPRRGLGWVHALTLGTMGLAAFLVAAGVAPALVHGDWDPGVEQAGNRQVIQQIESLLASEAERGGAFRALWVGDAWTLDSPSAMKPSGRHLLTGPRGQEMTDLYTTEPGNGNRVLEEVIDSIEAGDTDVGGALLATFNVEFVVVEPAAGASRWLGQRDLALIRHEPAYYVLQNQLFIPRAGAYPELPPVIGAIARQDAELVAPSSSDDEEEDSEPVTAHRTGFSSYTARSVRGPGSVWLSEGNDPGWRARVGDSELARSEGGWGNAWTIPPNASGPLAIEYPRSRGRLVQNIVILLAWAVAVGAAFSRRRVRTHTTEVEPG